MLADERSEIIDRRSTDISAFSSPNFCFGLANRKERWGLSWGGWLLLFFTIVVVSATVLFTIFPFLALTQRTQSDVLVVEGWIPEYAIRAAAAEFASGNYRHAFTTGGPVQGMGGYVNDYSTGSQHRRRPPKESGSAGCADGAVESDGAGPDLRSGHGATRVVSGE